jgi:Tol biopolymer transport system component
MQKYTLFISSRLAVVALLLGFFPLHLAAQAQAALFAPGLISDGGVFGLTLSPDGKTAVWVRAYGGRDSLHLFLSSLENGAWSKPQRAPFSTTGSQWKDIDPAFSPDGRMLLFNSTRPLIGSQAKPDFDLWAVQRQGAGWGQPYPLGAVLNSDSTDIYATMTHSGNIYFSSDRAGGQGKLDLYCSVYKNGSYQTPQNLGPILNSSGHDSNPFISAKEDYLIFWRQDPAGYGASDLYISFKVKGDWTKPLNLGPSINTAGGEFCPFMQPKGKKLYFARNEVVAGKRIENIYSIDFYPKKWKP